MKRIRVASLQYFIRPVTSESQFQDQVSALVETAADYGCQIVLFPEYFTVQLLTLGDVRAPIRDQIRDLATHVGAVHRVHAGAGDPPQDVPAGRHDPGRRSRDRRAAQRCALLQPRGQARHPGQAAHDPLRVGGLGRAAARRGCKVFETAFGKVAITICYDVEFPEIARTAARAGAHILLVPSCTDDRQGFLRVRYCAHARAIENQMYVIVSHTVGSLPMVPAVSLNYGQASILTPSDFPFSRDGILAEGHPNQEMMVIGDLNLETIQRHADVGHGAAAQRQPAHREDPRTPSRSRTCEGAGAPAAACSDDPRDHRHLPGDLPGGAVVDAGSSSPPISTCSPRGSSSPKRATRSSGWPRA